jgi:hypothetical protein
MHNLTRIILFSFVFSLIFSSCKKDETDEIVKNSHHWHLDDYTEGSTKAFQNGFVADEEAVVVLGRLDASYIVKNVSFFFGGSASTETVTLKIYRDKENGDEFPGELLYSGDFALTANDNVMQTLDISGENVTVANGGSIRVGVRFSHSGAPSVARDSKMDNSTKNLINQNGFWVTSASWNIDGDWIIRAEVQEL